MPAHARAPPTAPAAWQNQAGYASSSATNGSSQLQPPTGPSRGNQPAHHPLDMMPHPQQPPSLPPPPPPAAAPTTSISTVAALVPPANTDPPPIPTFSHIAYFTSIQLETLYTRQRGVRMSASTWHTNRDIATGFIQSVASRLGFPQRTTATAQQIYQRFHLFYPPSDFVLHEIAVASLFVAAKLNDTHKKPRDLLLASYALRFPHLVKGGGGSSAQDVASASPTEEPIFPTLAGQKRKLATTTAAERYTSSPRPLAMAIGGVGEADIDPTVLETDRKRLMALEKLIIESLCFHFHSSANTALKMLIKLGRKSNLSKSFIRTAWKIAADLFRTSAPMQYAPNVVAVAALYAAALLARPPARTRRSEAATMTSEMDDDADALVAFLKSIKSVSSTPVPQSTSSDDIERSIPLSEPFPGCNGDYYVHVEDVEEAVHELLDLYLSCAASLPPSLYMSSASGLGATHGHGSAAATPSPLSPADPMDAYGASPASSGSDPATQPSSAPKKLKQYEYSPPPFGLVDWLNSARCTQLQSGKKSVDPTAPTKELTSLLTDLKIYLRGIEYDRQRADDTFLATAGLVAEVRVVAVPGTEAAVEAVQPSMIGGASTAHSVVIELKRMSDVKRATKMDEILTELGPQEREVVERIRRRKLAAALRLTFVEPGVEKRQDVVKGANSKEQHHQPTFKQTATTTADPTLVVKKNRIDLAKRYLF